MGKLAAKKAGFAGFRGFFLGGTRSDFFLLRKYRPDIY